MGGEQDSMYKEARKRQQQMTEGSRPERIQHRSKHDSPSISLAGSSANRSYARGPGLLFQKAPQSPDPANTH
jgi:hypothetical protein